MALELIQFLAVNDPAPNVILVVVATLKLTVDQGEMPLKHYHQLIEALDRRVRMRHVME